MTVVAANENVRILNDPRLFVFKLASRFFFRCLHLCSGFLFVCLLFFNISLGDLKDNQEQSLAVIVRPFEAARKENSLK